jgi:colanic acid/amylovoran biosynthesis protein
VDDADMGREALRLCLFGAPWDTGNRGVEALSRSVISGIARSVPGSQVTVFDNGWGVRAAELDGAAVELCGVRGSRRVWRRESWTNVKVSERLGGLGSPVVDRLRRCAAVLDISGGDSFTDLYGTARLQSVSAPKLAALRAKRPLVLLPQTYGPFTSADSADVARRIVRASAMAWSRDADSHAVLLDLLGGDATVAREGVDVAFALPARAPDVSLPRGVRRALDARDDGGAPVVGVNISGLLWADTSAFGFQLDYRTSVVRLVRRLLDEDCEVVLVPHVRDVAHGRESDAVAAQAVLAAGSAKSRVHVLPDTLDASELKEVISRFDWFCGSRMHATIAGLSTGVPTAALSYSAKTRGVFASCGVGGEVIDARSTSTDDAVERLLDAFARRRTVGERLVRTVPPVVDRAQSQIPEICAWVQQTSRDAAAQLPAS